MRSRSWTGMLTQISPSGETHRDTFTCVHCGGMRHIAPGKDFDSCKKCFGPVCSGCYGKDCVPIEKWLELQERPTLRQKLGFG